MTEPIEALRRGILKEDEGHTLLLASKR